MTESTLTHTETKQTQRKPSSTQWFAFLTNKTTGTHQSLTAKSQRELKTQLNQLQDVEIHNIVKGKGFAIHVKKSFEFAKPEETLN